MSKLKQLAGQTAIYGLPGILGRFLNYLLVALHTRVFAEAEFGIITDLYAYVTFLMVILTYGMETGFFRFSNSEKNPEKVYTTILSSLLLTSTLFIFGIFVFTPNIANALQYSGNPEYIRWIGIILAADALTAIPFARLRHKNKALKFASFKFINIIIYIFFNLYFLWLCPILYKSNPDSIFIIGYSGTPNVGYVFIANLLASLATIILLLPEFLVKKFQFDFSLLKRILKYSLPLLLGGLMGMVNETLDRILLKYRLPENIDALEQIGIYGANYKLAIIMTIFIQMFRYAAEPFFFAQHKQSDAKESYAMILKFFSLFGMTIFLGIMFYLDIFKFFIGEPFHAGIKIVPIILLANLFLGIIYNLSIWYKLNNLTKYGILIASIGAAVTIGINWIFIPKYGYMASAWATLICYTSMMIISYFMGQKFYPVKYPVKRILGYLTLVGALFFISQTYVEFQLSIKLLLNTLLLGIFLAVVFYFEKDEILKAKK